MKSITFELISKEAVPDEKEFCRLKKNAGLEYLGELVDTETSKVFGIIVKYKGRFYTTERLGELGEAGFSCCPVAEGVKTTLSLFESKCDPEKCKPLNACPIYIEIWEVEVDDEGPIARYAFDMNQLEEAKKIVRANKDVDIRVSGERISRTKFLKK